MGKGQVAGIPNWIKKKIAELDERVNGLNSDMPHIQRGMANADVPQLTASFLDITFDEPFNDVPTVVATLFGKCEAGNPHRLTVSDMKPTGFRLWLYNGWSGGTGNIKATWIAML